MDGLFQYIKLIVSIDKIRIDLDITKSDCREDGCGELSRVNC
jgi:hypothetical protein